MDFGLGLKLGREFGEEKGEDENFLDLELVML